MGAVWAGDVARASGAAAAPVGPRLRGLPMSAVAREPIEWLWPGHLAAGMIHLIDGDPGLGKSTLTLDLAARASTGAPWPDGIVGGKPVTVLLLGAEDGLAHTVRPRLDVAGADVDRVHAVTDVVSAAGDERLPSLPLDVERLGDYAGEHEAGLVIVDPLMAYLGAEVNTSVDADVRRALRSLARMAEARRIAVLLVRHLRKAAGSALHRGGASIGIIGAARFGYVVGRLPDDPRRRAIASVKANLVPDQATLGFQLVDVGGVARVEWHGRVDVTADELVGGDGDGEEGRDAAAWLRAYLSEKGGSAEAADVLGAGHKVGFSKDALKRAKQRAGAVSRKGAMAAGWTWALHAEGSTKSAKGAGAEPPRSSLPSVLPSADDGDTTGPQPSA